MVSISSPIRSTAIRNGAAGGKEIDQPAAHAELARAHHLLHVVVAREHHLRAQRLQVEVCLRLQVERAARDVCARGQALQRGGDGNDADAECAGGELP
jgi:hypothetical protein